MSDIKWSLYVIVDREVSGGHSLPDLTRAAVAGGATVIQLRGKLGPTRPMGELGRELLTITRPAGVPLIVNDRVDLALAIGADGVHVGQDDMPALLARGLIGPQRVLGVSAGSVEEARRAEAHGADYLGVGDVFGTPSKADAGAPIGTEVLARIAAGVAIPVVAIGGVTLANVAEAIGAGAAGVAVISAVAGASDPTKAAARLLELVEGACRG